MHKPGAWRAVELVMGCAVVMAATILDPGSATANPGDLILTKTRPVPATNRAASSTARPVASSPAVAPAAIRRRAYPHFLLAHGFDIGHWMGSSAPRTHPDVVEGMRKRAALREALGPLAAEPGMITTTPGQDTIRIAMLRFDFANDRGGDSASTGDGKLRPLAARLAQSPARPDAAQSSVLCVAWRGAAAILPRPVPRPGRVSSSPSTRHAPDSAFHLTDMADYGPWKFSTDIYDVAVKLFRDCLVAADTTGRNIPWPSIDRVCLIHAGSDLQSDVSAGQQGGHPNVHPRRRRHGRRRGRTGEGRHGVRLHHCARDHHARTVYGVINAV